MKIRLTIVGAERKEAFYASKTGGAPRKVISYVCKSIINKADGTLDVGTIKVPESLVPEAQFPQGVLPGEYVVDYSAGRGFKEDAIIGVMVSFEVYNKSLGHDVKPIVAKA